MRAGPPAAPAPRRASFLRYWLPVLAYMGFIFSLSTVQTPGPTFFAGQDKFLHFQVYAGFGIVLARAFRAAFEGRTGLPWPVGAALVGSFVGVLDELYQRMVPGRTSDARDWVADTAGALAAILAMRIAWSLMPGRRPEPPGAGGAGISGVGSAP